MHRDIVEVLTRWGRWAADGNTGVDWSPVAAGFKGLLPLSTSLRVSCCDDDGLMVDACVCRLQRQRKFDELSVIMLYYVYGLPKRAIGRRMNISEGLVRHRLQVAEGFVDGCLSALDVRLDMDVLVGCKNNLKKH